MEALHDTTRARVKQWADDWKLAAPVLDEERWARLVAMTDRERTAMAVELLELYQPDRPGDDGDDVLRIQKAFASWRATR